MYRLIRPLFFQMDAERSHDLAINSLRWASQSRLALKSLRALYANRISSKPVEIMGLKLPHPLGLAAGLDKQGVAGDALSALGFSFIEYGTVTPRAQPGNPKPRLFRLNADKAIINRMGFNSIGLDAFLANIGKSQAAHIKGLNIGKNADTPIEKSIDDYVTGLKTVYSVADYICINISSPNTQNLRSLQDDAQLNALLLALSQARLKLADQTGRYTPFALKVAPDLKSQQFDDISKAVLTHKIDGLIASNTSLSRANLSHPLASEAGGLSGAPLAELATQCIAEFSQRLQGEISIIGVGGIDDAASAQAKMQAGASAIQLYSSLIYRGPAVVREIVNSL